MSSIFNLFNDDSKKDDIINIHISLNKNTDEEAYILYNTLKTIDTENVSDYHIYIAGMNMLFEYIVKNKLDKSPQSDEKLEESNDTVRITGLDALHGSQESFMEIYNRNNEFN